MEAARSKSLRPELNPLCQNKAMPKVLIIGSASMDLSVRVPHIAAAGETVLGPHYLLSPGGKGANTAVAAARAASSPDTVSFAGAVGADIYGQGVRQAFEKNGVNQTHLLELPHATGLALISVADDGENAITVASGANLHYLPLHLPTLEGLLFVALQLEIPLETVIAALQAARNAGVKCVLNAAPAQKLPPEVLRELLKNVDVLVVNALEVQTLSGVGELDKGTKFLLEQGPEAVVVTLGGKGCYARTRTLELNLPALKVNVLDTTGAGDTFTGVLTLRLSLGDPLERALKYASAAAALACGEVGAQSAMPWNREIETLLNAQP